MDESFFIDNIREAYKLRKERHADRNSSKMEMDASLYHLLMGSNQIVHNRGKALSYLGGGDRKRRHPYSGNAGGNDGPDDGGLSALIAHKRWPYPLKSNQLRYVPASLQLGGLLGSFQAQPRPIPFSGGGNGLTAAHFAPRPTHPIEP